MRPPSKLIRRLGADNVTRLSAVAGGTMLDVPGRFDQQSRFAHTFGDELALLLVFHFGYSRIYVPLGCDPKPVPLAAVDQLDWRNLSARSIARQLGCSERTAHTKRAILRAQEIAPIAQKPLAVD